MTIMALTRGIWSNDYFAMDESIKKHKERGGRMKAHKYWSLGALLTMFGTFYTGYKGLKSEHKYFAVGSLICMVMAIYSGHKMLSGKKKLKKELVNAEITVFERSGYISYANCGLPYYIGDVITDPEELTLQTPESFFKRFHINMKIHHEVIYIHPDRKTVSVKNLENGEINNNTKGCVKAMEKLPQHILFVLFYRKTDCILKEQIVQYFLIRENLQDQSTHKSKKL